MLTAGAGTPLAEIEATLAATRQMLAFEPADLRAALWRARGRGHARRHARLQSLGPRRLEGGRGARPFPRLHARSTAAARVFKAGGRGGEERHRLRSAKLMAGSFGTLAALAEVTIRVIRRRSGADAAAHRARCRSRQSRDELALGSAQDLSGAAYLPAALAARSTVDAVAGAGASVTALRLEGIAASVAARAAALERLMAEFGAPLLRIEAAESIGLWREIRDLHFLLPETAAVIWRLSLPPAEGAATAVRLAWRSRDEVLSRLGRRARLGRGPTGAGRSCPGGARAAAAAGGHATLMRAPDAVRASVPVFEPEPAPLAELTARVRAGFDPLGILNPAGWDSRIGPIRPGNQPLVK